MKVLRQKLAGGEFIITAEVDPPRGPDAAALLRRVEALAGGVDAVNVTDCPMANVRMSSIITAHLIQQATGVEAIFHITCRDRNVIGLQADLLGAAGLGVNNMLVLTGDPPERGNHPGARAVYELDTPDFVRMVSGLNKGVTLAGTELDAPTNFTVAVAANPGSADLDREINRLAEKVKAGASFVQTQPVFDLQTVEAFESKLREAGLDVPVLYGLLPLKSREFARRMARIPGIRVPQAVLQRMEEGAEDEGFRMAAELAAQMSTMVRGIHIFPMGGLQGVLAVTDALAERRAAG